MAEITTSPNDEKPNISGALQDFIDDIQYMMGLYAKQRYTQAEAQRDKLAEKLDDIMRLGGKPLVSGALSFPEVKSKILSGNAKSEYKQASIIMLRNIYSEAGAITD